MDSTDEYRTTSSSSPEESDSDQVSRGPPSTEPSNLFPEEPRNLLGDVPSVIVTPPSANSSFARPSSRPADAPSSITTTPEDSGGSSSAGPSSRPVEAPGDRGADQGHQSPYVGIRPPAVFGVDNNTNPVFQGQFNLSLNSALAQGTGPEAPACKGKGEEESVEENGKPEIKPFDAAETGKIPADQLFPRPEQKPAVRVAFISEEIGLGLVAARPFERGEWIFQEAPAISVAWAAMENHYASPQLLNSLREYMESFWIRDFQFQQGEQVMTTQGMALLRATFPRFAGALGRQLLPWDDTKLLLDYGLGTRLRGGLLERCTVENQQYEKWAENMPREDEVVEDIPTVEKVCRDFVTGYSFINESKMQSSNHNSPSAIRTANFYFLASLINHRCDPMRKRLSDRYHARRYTQAVGPPPIRGPNCAFRVGSMGLAAFTNDKHISAMALRDISEGEELTFDYGKTGKASKGLGFKCRCAECTRSVYRKARDVMHGWREKPAKDSAEGGGSGEKPNRIRNRLMKKKKSGDGTDMVGGETATVKKTSKKMRAIFNWKKTSDPKEDAPKEDAPKKEGPEEDWEEEDQEEDDPDKITHVPAMFV